MTNELTILQQKDIENRIFTIRGVQIMLDSDLAVLFQVETKNLNKAVKRNESRFPPTYRFQLTENEWQNLKFQFGTSNNPNLRSQFGTSSEHGGRRYLPYVFTEHGVAMLSSVLKRNSSKN